MRTLKPGTIVRLRRRTSSGYIGPCVVISHDETTGLLRLARGTVHPPAWCYPETIAAVRADVVLGGD